MDFQALEAVGDQFLNMAFEAGAGKDPWGPALEALAQATGALGAAVIPARARAPGPLPATLSIGEMIEAFVSEGWFARDLRARGAPVAFRDGICDDADCMPWEEMKKTSYYNDFLRRFDLGPFAALGVSTSQDAFGVSIIRRGPEKPFTREEKSRLRGLRARISTGAELLTRVDAARVEAIGDTLEAMREGAALVDRAGKILRMNAAAEALTRRGLILRQGALSSPHAANARDLEHHIAAALSSCGGPDVAARRFFLQRENRRPLILRVHRLTGPAWHYFSGAWGLAIFTDPECAPPPDPVLLASCFGLTAAEIVVVGELLRPDEEGRTDARSIAARLEISHHTVRAHIKSIFQKTGMRDRAALAALLARLS